MATKTKKPSKQLVILKLYLKAFLLSLVVIVPIGLYLGVRRGHYNIRDFTNTVALSSMGLLGIVLLLGPFARIFDIFDKFLQYRKELGIEAFFLGAFHVFSAMFLISRFGPFGLFLGAPLSAFAGLTALFIFIYLFVITFQKVKKNIPYKTWWQMQYWGVRITALLVLTHMLLIKASDWVDWYHGVYSSNVTFPSLPPTNLMVTVFMGFVVVVRLSEFIKEQFERQFITFYFICMVVGYMWLFIHPFI